MRVGLDALVGIERQAVAVDEVPDDPEGDVGVVAKPGIGEEDVGETAAARRESWFLRRRFRDMALRE